MEKPYRNLLFDRLQERIKKNTFRPLFEEDKITHEIILSLDNTFFNKDPKERLVEIKKIII